MCQQLFYSPILRNMNLPHEFTTQIRELLGSDHEAFLNALEKESETSIRLNPTKQHPTLALPSVEWCEMGYYTPQRPDFTFDPLFHAGCYYVQEASSMFLSQILHQYIGNTPIKYLDLCAAPGGKTTLALSLLPKGSFLVANEPIRQRANILAENTIKWGNPNVVVTNNHPNDFSPFESCFDIILTDVPCSGEGMFRKDRGAIAEWSPANVKLCASRQLDIINSAWELLREGGLLIYSTCTYNTIENEDVIDYLIKEKGGEALVVETPFDWNISRAMKGDHPVYRFLPHKTKGEGLFMAALRKPLQSEAKMRVEPRSKMKVKTQPAKAVPFTSYNYLQNPDHYEFICQPEQVNAIDHNHANFLRALSDKLRIVHSGIEVALLKGKEWIPSPSLALSIELNREEFTTVDVDLKTAISFLRCEALILPQETSKGIVLITYKNTPLGWVKNIGNRANNLYPTEWRIRSGYTPDTIRCLSDLADPA